MKKFLLIAIVALLTLALVACGGPADTTEKSADTTTAGKVDTTTAGKTDDTTAAPDNTTAAPDTTTTPETTEPQPSTTPVFDEIMAATETGHWQSVHRMNQITYSKEDGVTHYTWSMTIKAESELFPYLPSDHPEYPDLPSLQLSTADGAFVYIKDVNKDEDFTKYTVTNWKTARWCDIWFEAEGFVPTADGEYDMYLFFTMPEGSAYPGETVFVWALGEYWTYNMPKISGIPEIDQYALDAHQCTLHRHNEYHTAEVDGVKYTKTFNFTVKSEDGYFPRLDVINSINEVTNVGAFAFIKGPGEEEFTRYNISWLTTARWCDIWFYVEGFEPVVGEQYEMYFFFLSGPNATYPNSYHYVYADDWFIVDPEA